MRYTDEGNLRFVGNTRTSTSTQGVYRQEFDSGKWAVTLTNTEPGLGYLGYNVEALSYDFENSRLCTENIRASCVEVSGRVSAPYINVLDTIYAQCLESCDGLCFECGCISNGPAEIRIYGRPNCSPSDGCLVVADNYLCYCTSNGCASITVGPDKLYLGGNIRAGNAPYLCVEDTLVDGFLFTNPSFDCHYIYGIRRNGLDTFTATGILDIGTVGAAVEVNGTCYVANDSGLMSLPNMTTSVTLNNITTPVDSNGNIDLGTIAATVNLNSNNSLFITNCAITGNLEESISLGYNTKVTGNWSVAIGCGAEAGVGSVSIGSKAKANNNNCSDISAINIQNEHWNGYANVSWSSFTKQCDLYNLLHCMFCMYESPYNDTKPAFIDKILYKSNNFTFTGIDCSIMCLNAHTCVGGSCCYYIDLNGTTCFTINAGCTDQMGGCYRTVLYFLY